MQGDVLFRLRYCNRIIVRHTESDGREIFSGSLQGDLETGGSCTGCICFVQGTVK